MESDKYQVQGAKFDGIYTINAVYSGNSKVSIQKDDFLNTKIVTRVVYPGEDMSVDQYGVVAIGAGAGQLGTAYKQVHLTLVDKDNRSVIDAVPLSMFLRDVDRQNVPILNREIEWSKSFFGIGINTNIATGESLTLVVYYRNK